MKSKTRKEKDDQVDILYTITSFDKEGIEQCMSHPVGETSVCFPFVCESRKLMERLLEETKITNPEIKNPKIVRFIRE